MPRLTQQMIDYNEKFDATGLNCPLPIMRSKRIMSRLDSGEVLYVICTDNGSIKDFGAFCKQSGHQLMDSFESENKYHYFIRKA